jgi:holin-like protein
LVVGAVLLVSVILTIAVTAIVLKVFWYFSLKRNKGIGREQRHE